jgi:hypothetical protein
MTQTLTPKQEAAIRERLQPFEVKFTKHYAIMVRTSSDKPWTLLCGPCSNWSYITSAYAIGGLE